MQGKVTVSITIQYTNGAIFSLPLPLSDKDNDVLAALVPDGMWLDVVVPETLPSCLMECG